MATTAKQSSSVRSSSSSPAPQSPTTFSDGEEDIETIAKQISDHAEAIYQTWKARGLAPTEILNCHTGNSDAFGKTLTPSHRKKESPVTELFAQTPDMSNNNLEKLVSSFVNEDKARQQAARKSSILTSGTIKDALRKFECADRTSSTVKPNFLRNSTSPQPNSQRALSPTVPATATPICPGSNNVNVSKLNKNVPDVLMNTIETVVIKPVKEVSPPPNKQKPETPAKPANLLNHTPTWPLKNRLGIGNGGKKSATLNSSNSSCSNNINNLNSNPKNSNETKSINKNSVDIMDAVLMEEERLINALKTGTVLNNDKPLPEVITSTLNDSTTWTKPDISTTSSIKTQITLQNSIQNQSISAVARLDDQHHKPITKGPSASSLGSGNSGGVAVVTQPLKITKQPRPRNDAAVPHPEVNLNSIKLNHVNVRNVSTQPAVRPFLTRGSVAERVLMFEKCPEVKALRTVPKEPSKLSVS